MSEPARKYEPADLSVRPATPEAQAWVDSLNADIADGSLWKTPSIRLQLREHRQRLGLTE